MACDVLLIVAMIVCLLKYQKTMQAMLTAFLQTNTKNSAIQSVQADQIGRTYPPLFTLNLPKEEEIIDDLREIAAMEYAVQVIMIIVCIAIVLIIMYFCCTKCRHTCAIFKYCFPFLPILCICHAHWEGGSSQGSTRHSLPLARRRGGFNCNDQLNSSTER